MKFPCGSNIAFIVGSLFAQDCLTAEVRCAGRCEREVAADHALLQHKTQKSSISKLVAACTSVGQDPYSSGKFAECCEGSRKQVGRWSSTRSDWYWLCKPDGTEVQAEKCTKVNKDPYGSGSFVKCCAGLEKRVGKWSKHRSDWHWLCKAGNGGTTRNPDPVVSATTGSESRIMQWNIHWKNKDTAGIASIVQPNNVDIVGLCEVTASMQSVATSLSAATGRRFKVQPGRDSWVGYGTDIFYDDGKWKALDGGVKRAGCSGSKGGPRAVNWAVLKERSSGKVLITGGIHTSYCSGGCDDLHACELTEMYDKFEEMKRKYQNAPVVWMGDVNRNIRSTVMRRLIGGNTGRRSTFKVDDLAKTNTNTYYTGGSAIDHIMGEHNIFNVVAGGSTGQGARGQHLKGADHFPIYAHVRWN